MPQHVHQACCLHLLLQDLISKCKVVVESNFELAILGTYQRKKAFKRLPVDLSGHQASAPRTRMLVERDAKDATEKVLRHELIAYQGSQNTHGEGVHGANSLAAWFDLNTMRARGNNEQTVSKAAAFELTPMFAG